MKLAKIQKNSQKTNKKELKIDWNSTPKVAGSWNWPGRLMKLVRQVDETGQTSWWNWEGNLMKLARLIGETVQLGWWNWPGRLMKLARQVDETGQAGRWNWPGRLLKLASWVDKTGQNTKEQPKKVPKNCYKLTKIWLAWQVDETCKAGWWQSQGRLMKLARQVDEKAKKCKKKTSL